MSQDGKLVCRFASAGSGSVGSGSAGFRDPADADIDLRDLVPCGIVHDAGRRKIEDALKSADGVGGGGSVQAVGRDLRYGGIILADAVQLLLYLEDFVAGSGRGDAEDA